ncbi:PREDICTED: LOC110785510 isoform [Prunus dulcis]|nr:PREDICTED: LOC110785510 isoform [Prunus dulcis]
MADSVGGKERPRCGQREGASSSRIADECSESTPREETIPHSMNKEKKKKRVSVRFSTTLGVIVRECVPINIESWDQVTPSIKNRAWTLLMQKFIVEDWHKKFILRVMDKLWRNWKSKLSVQIRRILESRSDVARHMVLLKPSDATQEEWDAFVAERMSDKWKENIKEKMVEAPASENPISIKEDALTQVLGKEHPGRVRGLGFGVTPS